MSKKKFAIIGRPIAHSLSPTLHNYWFKKYNIDAEYSLLDVKEENLEDTINEFKVTTCECTCVGCYIECMGVRGRYSSNDDWYSDYYDDDDDCNEHSDFEYD